MMQATRDEVLKAALQLSEADRLAIANELLDTLPEDLPGLSDDDPDFAEELERRSGDLEGSMKWEELREEFRRTP
jgi:hypothetical protein